MVVFAMPEAICIEQFRDYMDRLYNTNKLDCVVMDKYHTMFDSYRPAMSKIGSVMKS